MRVIDIHRVVLVRRLGLEIMGNAQGPQFFNAILNKDRLNLEALKDFRSHFPVNPSRSAMQALSAF